MTDAPKRIWEFDRYINGVLMAEGVTVEKQPDIASAMKAAAIIAPRGPHGEVPVLIVREYASEHAALIREAEDRVWERAAVIAENVDYPWEQGEHLSQMMASDATACAVAAAIRAAKATP